MTRISKDPLERKNEIIDIAEALFNSRGYEQTTVSDIVKQVGVAQGLFYYYFKSKEEVLEAIAHRYADLVLHAYQTIADDTHLSPTAKLKQILIATFKVSEGRENVFLTVHQAANESIHQKISVVMLKKLMPILTGIVQEGITQGIFTIPDAQVTTEIVFYGMEHYLNRKMRECFGTPEFDTQMQLAIATLERALTAPSSSLQF